MKNYEIKACKCKYGNRWCSLLFSEKSLKLEFYYSIMSFLSFLLLCIFHCWAFFFFAKIFIAELVPKTEFTSKSDQQLRFHCDLAPKIISGTIDLSRFFFGGVSEKNEKKLNLFWWKSIQCRPENLQGIRVKIKSMLKPDPNAAINGRIEFYVLDWKLNHIFFQGVSLHLWLWLGLDLTKQKSRRDVCFRMFRSQEEKLLVLWCLIVLGRSFPMCLFSRRCNKRTYHRSLIFS